MKRLLNELIGRQVIVQTGDVSYRGALCEVNEERVCLRGLTGWREIPLERVVAIRAAAPK